MALVHGVLRDCAPPTDHNFPGRGNEFEIDTIRLEFAFGPLSHHPPQSARSLEISVNRLRQKGRPIVSGDDDRHFRSFRHRWVVSFRCRNRSTTTHLARQVTPAFHDAAFRFISLLGFPQQTVNTVPDAVYRQIGKNPQKDRIGPVNASTESFPVFNRAIVLTPVTRWTELVVNHSMRRIADFETCFADAYRILSVLAEPRGSRSEAGVELTHFVKDCSL